jgi:hypothetical protein
MHGPRIRGRARCRWALPVALLCSLIAAAPSAAGGLPPLPHGWPKTMQIGLTDAPGGAHALRASAAFGFRYQYLAGGANTGSGWSTWNPDGTFVTRYVDESRAAHVIPVFTYYQLLQSKPGGGDEAHADLANLQNADTMHAYWADLELFFRRAKGSKPVVLHVEPDLWGYIEQASTGDDGASVPAVVPDGLPQNAAGFAQEFVHMRDRLAPNVILAWHMSGWGTQHDIGYEDPPDRTVVAYATRSAAFYRSLGAAFDLSFEDFSDRDAGYYEKVEGNPKTWFKPADFHRHLLYGRTFVRLAGIRMAAWQIPLGNTEMRAMDNTTGHYQDNRVQWLLEGASGRAHMRAYVKAGYIGFLFGGGAGGTTCACDGQKDGVTNPAPIGKNTRTSLSADDDGGLFRSLARAYYRHGAVHLPA